MRKKPMKDFPIFFMTFFLFFLSLLHAGEGRAEEKDFRILFFSECGEERQGDCDNAFSASLRKAFLEKLQTLFSESLKKEMPFVVQNGNGLQFSAESPPADLVLVSDLAILKKLLEEAKGDVPVVALNQAFLPEILPLKKAPFPLLLSSDSFWQERFFSFYRAAGFQRPGFILPEPDASEKETLISGSLIKAGEAWQKTTKKNFFFYGDLTDRGPSQCREAVDYLFFDEIDAMILDGNPCFDPDRPDFNELMTLLHQRGILPLSLADPQFSGRGVLLGVTAKDLELRGKSLAAETFRSFFAKKDSEKIKEESPFPETILWQGEAQAAFFLDLGIARKMGFDPPAFLLGLSEIPEE